MVFKRYTTRALQEICNMICEHMRAADREETQNEFYVWQDLYEAIQRELDRRDPGKDNHGVNEYIRRLIKAKHLRNYEIAAYMAISESSFSKLLRKQLSPERKEEVLKAIESMRT